MIKEATTQYAVHPLLSKRWSARAFTPQPLTHNDVFTLVEAAGWAPSSMNDQPWHYHYALRGTPGFNTMWNLLSKGNQLWADKAAVLILSVARKTFVKDGSYNRHYLHDTGMANANLLTQALSMGIYGHILGGYDHEATIKTFDLDENQEPVAFIALGYLGEADTLEEPFKTRELTPRTRRPVQETVQVFKEQE